jgi:hypothetical protein
MPFYCISGATQLQLLAELAAAKGQPDLANDIRRVARILMGAPSPSSSLSDAADADAAALAGADPVPRSRQIHQ